MPETETELRNLQRRFYQIAGFPRTIGAIDCTHIKIQNPGGPNGEYFRNREGYFSLNVQTISCPDLKIMDVVARWPCPEELYNESLIRTRNSVERSYGVLKRRFPILSFGSRLKIETTQAMVVACCVLHNIACDHNDLEPPELLGMRMPVIDDLNLREEHEPKEGNARQQLTEEYFQF
ncbi:Uncharacterized protein FWK35_00013165 [Aphis craccivora]|uniref:DDE Tnp4 domain-containing protein n=1 Tax=Aphis craccivora TaxID=307492 RepID=A0A6G0Y791_APHCR|nr:Uncharacterized protein FWK35_00013165 [Aphis craccivora]